jgi:hypothetical protein
MKNILLVLILSVSLYSCKKNDECKYKLDLFPNDTSLYISYTFKGEKYIFYQDGQDSPISNNNTSLTLNNKSIWQVSNTYYFDDFNRNNINITQPRVILTFWDTVLVKDNNIHDRYLSQKILKQYKFTYPKQNPTLNDTVFMVGVSLSIKYHQFATLYWVYNLNYPYEELLNNSYLIVSKTENVCDNMILIEGHFSTKLGDASPYSYPIDGKFRFITH